jgi:hypothetical protein
LVPTSTRHQSIPFHVECLLSGGQSRHSEWPCEDTSVRLAVLLDAFELEY